MDQKGEYTKVKIEEPFDLEKTARKYRIGLEDMLTFHNLHCSFSEYIRSIDLDITRYIYLPTAIYNQWKDKQLATNYLVLPKQSSMDRYGVTIDYLPRTMNVRYEIEANRKDRMMRLKKGKSYVDDQELDTVIEEMVEKAEETLYPLELNLQENGMFDKVLNEEEIKDRWQNKIYPQLAEYYKGDVAEKILQKLEDKFVKIDTYKNGLRRNLFYQLFFAPIYQNYFDGVKKDECYIYFPAVASFVKYEITYTLEKEYTSLGKIVLKIQGTDHKNKGNIIILYKLEKETNAIFSVVANVSTFHEGIEHKMSLSVYRLA